MAETHTPRIVVAGGGVAGLEACLALRSFLGEPDLDIALLCREDRFEYRPLAVLEPFEGAPAWSMKLERFAADQEVRLVVDALAGVDPDRHVAITAYSGRLSYEALLVCVGARPVRGLPGAITFRGGRDAAAVRAALDAVQPGEAATIAFAVPFGAFWTLPLYELAILAAARLQTRGTRAKVLITSPESAPLEAFGAAASTAVAQLLDAHGIEFTSHARAVAADAGELALDDGRRIATTAVVTLPNLVGRRVPGIPQDSEGFIAVDEHGRVPGADGVYAAGDVTTFPLKQGGLATQQADAAAEAMLAALGVPIVPRPFEPVLKGVLYTDREPAYLHARVAAGTGSEPRAYSMWWPPSKIAGRHLAPYLATRAGAPRAPEVRPERDAIAVSIDVPRAVRAVSSALDVNAVPPG
ncbi:MAG TPA: FAD-dependent oxidoreductase [Solirubrobacteraceae bacterium]|nr:FAD-dependent oxidoreductase [Solirubrobacteraceae bacterium]